MRRASSDEAESLAPRLDQIGFVQRVGVTYRTSGYGRESWVLMDVERCQRRRNNEF